MCVGWNLLEKSEINGIQGNKIEKLPFVGIAQSEKQAFIGNN